MRERIRNWASIVVAGLCLGLAIPALLAPPTALNGITLGFEGSVLIVAAVDPDSDIISDVRPGMPVYELNYVPIEDISSTEMDAILQGSFFEVGVIHPSFGRMVLSLPTEVVAPLPGFVFVVGLGLLFGTTIWVRRGQAGESLRPLAVPLAAASAAPLMLNPAWAVLDWPTVVFGISLSVIALALLADGFTERIENGTSRRFAAIVTVVAGVGCVLVAAGEVAPGLSAVPIADMASLQGFPAMLAAAVTMVPAAVLVVAGDGPSSDRVPILLAALTPLVIGMTHDFSYFGVGLTVAVLWLLVVAFFLQGNARVEILRLQRDTVVAATEVERARLAADLHDDALQEMTVLVRRLDDGGDARAAELARSIADRLREVCGDLRLPVLDELGAGPALEWLVARVGETSGHEVRLEREDEGRPPAAVELAVFRVAQEALANAVAHGAPPVVVRYAAATDRATLSISDQGVGIPPDAPASAPRSGHYGLLNMRQRAEQIGARIEVRRPPSGGTLIGLTWAST